MGMPNKAPFLIRLVLGCIVALFAGAVPARAEKPPKIPVAIGTWTGPHANRFKSGVRSGAAKECAVVKKEKARVIVDGEVVEQDKRWKVRMIVKSPKTDEIVESKEYTYSKPELSQAQSHRMGRDLFEMARRAPEPD